MKQDEDIRRIRARVDSYLDQNLVRARRRRQALSYAECTSYIIGTEVNEKWTENILLLGGEYCETFTYITCLCCGTKSHDIEDIRNRYCGFCHEIHLYIKEATDE